MLVKKLLTVACALGILACGACFLPPIPAPRHPAPPTPVQAGLHGIHRIRVVATNVSDSRHLNADELAMEVANRINWLARDTGITASASSQTGDEEAVLEVKIDKESATPSTVFSTEKVEAWSFSIEVSTTLMDRGGRILWQDVDPADSFLVTFPRDPSGDIWSRPGRDVSVPQFVARRVAYRALYK
jgi:hypothetical protein